MPVYSRLDLKDDGELLNDLRNIIGNSAPRIDESTRTILMFKLAHYVKERENGAKSN